MVSLNDFVAQMLMTQFSLIVSEQQQTRPDFERINESILGATYAIQMINEGNVAGLIDIKSEQMEMLMAKYQLMNQEFKANT